MAIKQQFALTNNSRFILTETSDQLQTEWLKKLIALPIIGSNVDKESQIFF